MITPKLLAARRRERAAVQARLARAEFDLRVIDLEDEILAWLFPPNRGPHEGFATQSESTAVVHAVAARFRNRGWAVEEGFTAVGGTRCLIFSAPEKTAREAQKESPCP